MPLIGHANVEIRAVDKFFERDVRKIVGNLKDVTVKLRADVDMKPVYTKLRTLRKSALVKQTIMLNVDANPKAVYNKMDEVWDDFDGRAFTLLVDEEGLDPIHEKIKNIKEVLEDTHLKLDAEVDTSAEEARLTWLARTRTANIKTQLDPKTTAAFMGAFHTLTGTLPVQAVKDFFTGVTAHFEALSVKSAAFSTAILGAGAALLKFGGDAFVIADDITQVVGVLAAAPALIGTFGLSITALTLGWKNFGKAFDDNKAFAQLPKQAQETVNSMRGMGTAIRRATQTSYWSALGDSVKSFMTVLRGPLTTALSESGRVMGLQTKSMADMMKSFVSSGAFASTMKDLNKGLENGSAAVGGFTKGFLELMQGGAKSMPAFGTWMSKIGTQFGNWAEDANKTGKITEWIDQAVVRLQQLGSIAKSTVGIFQSIADAARTAGLDGLKQLADGMKNVNDAMKTPAFQGGLVTVFKSADKAMSNMAPGMGKFFGELGGHTEEIGGLMESAGTIIGQFFTNIGTLLSRDKFWGGLKDLMDGTSSAMKKMEPGFARLGDAIGNTFSIMGTVVDNVAPGLNLLFDTIAQLTDALGPGIKAVIPIFNEFVQGLMTAIKTVVVPIAQAVGKVMEAFAALPGPVQTAIMSIAALPVAGLLAAKGIGAISTVVGALVGNLKLGTGALGGFASALGLLMTGKLGAAGSAIAGIGTSAAAMRLNTKKASKLSAADMAVMAAAASGAADKTSKSVDKSAKAISGGKGGFIGKLFGGAAIGAMGGPVGLLVGVGVAAVAAVGIGIATEVKKQKDAIKAQAEKAQSDTKAYVEAYDKVTGSIGATSTAVAAKNLGDTMFELGGAQKSFTEVASGVGQSTDDIAKKLTSGLPAFKEYGSTWNDVRAKMGDAKGMNEQYNKSFTELDHKLQNAYDIGDMGTAQKINEQRDALAQMRVNWDKNQEGAGAYFRKVSGFSDEQVQKLDMSVSDFDRMTKDQVESMARGISGQYDAIGAAGKKSALEVQKAYADASILAMSENEKVLNSSTSSAEQKLGAFQSNLAATGRSAIAQVEQQAYQTQIAVTAVKDGMKSMNTALADKGWNKDNAKGMLNTSKTVKGVLDYTKKGSQEVFQTMSTQAGTIQSAFVSAYDTAIKQNGNMETSLKSAMTSIQPMMDSVRTGLSKTFDKGTVDKIMKSFNLDETSFRVGITADGSEAVAEALKVEKALAVLKSGDYKALLKVDSTNAQGEVEKVLGLGKTFTNETFEAALKVEASNANMDFESFIARFQNAPDQKQFLLNARAQGIDEVASKMDLLDGKANELDNKTISTFLTAKADSGQLDEFKAKFDGLSGKQKEAVIKAILEGGNVQQTLDGFEKPKKAAVKAELDKGGVEGELKGLEAPLKTPVTPEIQGNARGLIEGELRGIEAPVKAVPDSGGTWFSSLASKFSTPIEQRITPTIGDIPKITIPDTTANIKVVVDKGGIDSVRSAIDGIKNKSVSITVKANSGGVESIKNAIGGLKNKTVSISVKANPAGIKSVSSAVSALKNKTVTVTAVANVGPIKSINSAVAGLKNKTVTVKAETSAAMSGVKALQSAKIANKTFSITANAGPALAAIASVNARQVSNKSNTITTYVRTVNQNAEGGVYAGNVRTFASGGMDKVQKAIERHKRIGGSENRVAQIAKGSENYRVWGETETQGEAYIPLGKNKRSRSLKILQQVMDHFGVQAAQTFSNGGVLAGKAMGAGITSFASGGVSNSTAAKNAARKAAADAKKAAAAAKRVADAERKVKREQAQYNAINGKKVNAAKKKAAKAELDAAKKQLAAAKKTQTAAKKAQTSSKDALKKQQEITKNANKDKRAVLTGFRNDVNNQFGYQKSPLQANIAGLRKEASTFISTYKKTRPKEAKAMEKVSKKLAAQASPSKAYTKEVNKYGGTVASARLANRVQNVQKTKSKRDDALPGITLRDYELAISRTETAREKAETELAKLEQERKSVIDSIKTSVSGEFDLKDFAGGTNKAGFRNSMTAKGLSSYAKDKLTKIQNFSKLVKDLLGAGYNPSLVQEIALMGVEDGTSLAQALMKDKSQKTSLNASYVGIDKAATSMGTAVGDKMYNTGIDLNKGLIAGLKADEKALKEAAVYLGDLLYKEFKKAMGIKSPSRVMAKLGKFIPQGVALGIDSEQDVVKKSIQDLVRPADLTLNGNKTANGLPSLVKPASSNGIIGGVVPEIHVHPSPGMDEVLVGQAAAREMMYRLQ